MLSLFSKFCKVGLKTAKQCSGVNIETDENETTVRTTEGTTGGYRGLESYVRCDLSTVDRTLHTLVMDVMII